jgi:hypothetical protein
MPSDTADLNIRTRTSVNIRTELTPRVASARVLLKGYGSESVEAEISFALLFALGFLPIVILFQFEEKTQKRALVHCNRALKITVNS